MGTNPDQLTEDIAATRGRMSTTVDEIREQVSPRQGLEHRADSARESIAHGTSAVTRQARHAADEVRGRSRQMVHTMTDTARERPLVSGLAAFGAGLLFGALAPSSDTERRAARQLRDDLAEPMREAVSESAHRVGDTVQERAADAVEHVKDDAGQAVDDTKAESAEALEAARQRAGEAAEHVRDDITHRS